jgi:hypothetical protein
LLAVLGSDRPIHEILNPNFQDQRAAMENQFSGMSEEEFSYEEYEAVRVQLVQAIHAGLTQEDKAFLLSVKGLTPDWNKYDFADFPSIKWKLQNLRMLKDQNPDKHAQHYNNLTEFFNGLQV